MQKVNKVLAIVGGGSVATSFLCQFAESIDKSSRYALKLGISEVLIFEPKHTGGAGNAYQDDIDSNLLNTRAGTMSPMPSDPDHFLRWLSTTESEWREQYPTLEVNTNSFLPRALFGKYLEHVFSETITKLKILGFRIKRVLQELVAIDPILDGYKLTSSNSLKFHADYVVLAIGNHASTDMSNMEAHSEYFNTPYPCKKLTAEIEKNKSVCILGTSLSAIDAAVSLTDAGHTGKIFMVSRNGRLPSVRGEFNVKRLPSLLSRERVQKLVDGDGVLRLDTVKNLLLEELLMAEGVIPNLPLIMRETAGPQHYIDCEIADASVRDRVWQAIVYGLNDSIDLIWHLLSDSDKNTFNQIYKSQWLAYRVSFPLQNALKVQKLLQTNQLTVFGGFESLRFDDALGLFGVQIHERKIEHRATLFSDYVVNATGYQPFLRKLWLRMRVLTRR